MKSTLAFDVYGTIINTSGVYDLLETFMDKNAKPFMDAWRNKQLEYSFRRGLMNKYADFSICTKQALEFCCLTFQIELSSGQKAALLEEYRVLPAFPDVQAGLQNLRESGYKIYAFSNGSESAISGLLKNANIMEYFHGIVSVEDIKMFKPSPLVYAHFNKKTNSAIPDSWLISSNPFDVIGAISYGMRSAWVQRTPEAVFDPWGVEPTTIINKITDLKSALEKTE